MSLTSGIESLLLGELPCSPWLASHLLRRFPRGKRANIPIRRLEGALGPGAVFRLRRSRENRKRGGDRQAQTIVVHQSSGKQSPPTQGVSGPKQ